MVADMGKLTKRDIVVAISNQTGMVQHEVFEVVQRTLDHITDSLAKNVAVELRNFGVFQPRLTKPRVGRNPNEPGSSFVIPPRATVKFKAGKIMRQRVEKLSRELKEAAEKAQNGAAGSSEGSGRDRDLTQLLSLKILFGTGRFQFQEVLNDLLQPIEVDRLRQMIGEARLARAADIVLHPESAQGDSAQAFAGL